MNIKQFVNQPKSSEWIVDDLIPRGHKILVAGQPGSGKSWFVEGLALHVAENVPFLGFDVKGGAVLLVDEETTEDTLRSRLLKLRSGLNISDYYNRLEILSMEGIQLDNTRGQQKIMSHIKNSNPVLVIFDVLNRFLSRFDENKAGDISKFINTVGSFQQVCGSTIIIVHHMRKYCKGADFISSVRGSSALPAASDSAFTIAAIPMSNGSQFAVQPEPRKIKLEVEPFKVKLTESDTAIQLERTGVWNPDLEGHIDLLRQIIQLFRTQGQDLTVREVDKALGGLASETEIRNALKTLSGDKGPLEWYTNAHNLFKYNLRPNHDDYLNGKFELLREYDNN